MTIGICIFSACRLRIGIKTELAAKGITMHNKKKLSSYLIFNTRFFARFDRLWVNKKSLQKKRPSASVKRPKISRHHRCKQAQIQTLRSLL